jgi:hypothetical protein
VQQLTILDNTAPRTLSLVCNGLADLFVFDNAPVARCARRSTSCSTTWSFASESLPTTGSRAELVCADASISGDVHLQLTCLTASGQSQTQNTTLQFQPGSCTNSGMTTVVVRNLINIQMLCRHPRLYLAMDLNDFARSKHQYCRTFVGIIYLDGLVKSCEAGVEVHRQAQEIAISTMFVAANAVLAKAGFRNRDCIGQEAVLRVFAKSSYQFERVVCTGKGVAVTRIAGDTNKAQFGDGAGGKGLLPVGEPVSGACMLGVLEIKQRNQGIDVQERGHVSSRNAFTDSKVALPAPGCIGMKGNPVPSAGGVCVFSTSRSSSLTSCPAVFRWNVATRFTASSTSSSKSSVVRIFFPFASIVC